jgi:hypothetical protein
MFVGVAKKPQHLDAPIAANIAKPPELCGHLGADPAFCGG